MKNANLKEIPVIPELLYLPAIKMLENGLLKKIPRDYF
jgi:hypothetical protein